VCSAKIIVVALLVLASPLRAQHPRAPYGLDSLQRADSVADDSLWKSVLHQVYGPAADTMKPASAFAPAAATTPSANPTAPAPAAAAAAAAGAVPAAAADRTAAQKTPVDTTRARAPSGQAASVAAAGVVVGAAAGAAAASASHPPALDSVTAAQWGQQTWKSRQCGGCHQLGRDQATGPNLIGVTNRRTTQWLQNWLKNPVRMARDDPTGADLKRQYGSQMPNLGLNDQDIEGLIIFLDRESKARAQKHKHAPAAPAVAATAAAATAASGKSAPAAPPAAAPVAAAPAPAAPAKPAPAPAAPAAATAAPAAAAAAAAAPAPAPAPAPAAVPAPVSHRAADTAASYAASLDSANEAHWGQRAWNSRQCSGCHELGRDQSSGPNLIGVTQRRTTEWLRKWLKNPVTMAQDDPIAMDLKKKYGSQMPNLQLTDQDINGLIIYLDRETKARAKH